MVTINPYLNFNGNAEEAFNFYKSVFGGEFIIVQRYKDSPDTSKIAKEDMDKILHISLPIGKNNILMASDIPKGMNFPYNPGNNYHFSLETDSKEETARIYNALSKGGKVHMELGDTFWGAYFGMFADKFGIQWMVSYTYPKEK